MVRSSHVALALTLAGALAACTAPPQDDIPWAELSKVARTFRGTDLISRAAPDSLSALGKGWSADADTPLAGGFWAVGVEADFNLIAVRDGVHELVFDAMLPDGMPEQLLGVRINGTPVGEPVTLTHAWSRRRMRLTSDELVVGYNQVRFSFRHVIRPSDLGGRDADDHRPLAARFRFIQLVAVGSDRELGDETDPDLLLAHDQPLPATTPAVRAGNPWVPAVLEPAEVDGPLQLVVEADSILQLALTVPSDAHLVGNGTATAPETGGNIEWIAEVLTNEASHELGRGSNGRLSADLSSYAGQEVVLRLRTVGSRGTAVVWNGLGVSDPDHEFDRQALEPPALPVNRKSGILGQPDIVLIVLDAARADFMSTYRGVVPTPAIDALASEGTRFEHAYAAAPWTNESMYSLLSGRYPEAHGVAAWRDVPPRDLRSLFQLTYAAGYHTVLWSEHPLYRATKALRYDVDQYIDMRPRERVAMRAQLSRPDIFRPDKPTFALIHLIPPHDPYLWNEARGVGAPPPWANSMMRDFSTDFDLDARNLQSFSHSVGDSPPSDDDIRYVAARYQDNVRYADELVRRVVEGLKRAGRYDNTLLMVLSDHGEAFYDHGTFLHTWPLYNELLHIPLVIKWPNRATSFLRSVDRAVSNIDIAPTIVDAIGFQGDDPGHQGESLLPLVFDGFFPTRPVYASTVGVANGLDDYEPLKPMGSLIEHPYKVIHDKVNGRVELYDLAADPGETRDIVVDHPVMAQRLLQALFLQEQANWRLNAGAEASDPDAEIDPELRSQLCALGYVEC